MEFLSNNFISEFLVTVLNAIYSIVNDYSITIIILTLLIRLIMLPLDLKQKKSSRMMANLGPEIESLKKRYANNPEQINAKTQALYKEKGVKPLAGCLPMLISLPILFAFFGALRVIASEQTLGLLLNASAYGVEATSMPNWLWVHNFWQPDSGLSAIFQSATDFGNFVSQNINYIKPEAMCMLKDQGILTLASGQIAVNESVYSGITSGMINANGLSGLSNGWFILPVLAGASLFLQQRFTTQPAMQTAEGSGKFMKYFFPLFSVYICATSNTAFSVYWLISNLYALAQSSIIELIYKRRAKEEAGLQKS